MTKLISIDDLHALSQEAQAAPRRRMNRNLHVALADPVQRLFNAFEPGTYVRPHRHAHGDRWELFLVVSGKAAVLTFDDGGKVTERFELDAAGPLRLVEIAAGAWHTVASLAPGTVLFEVKPGPYAPPAEKEVADWAPAEGAPRAAALERWLRGARPGDTGPT